ncbi:hypothetical protein [Maribellus sediminis]|uniref:hypothetical protein n=1 Tax=Maribellus sediminis TaxID=2696285 RepID=UPI00142F9C7C|nr:hypothetical protein [Maribellus sediminis]
MNLINSEKKLPSPLHIILIVITVFFSACKPETGQKYETENWSILVNTKGQIVSWFDEINLQDVLLPEQESYLLSLKVDSSILHPVKAAFSEEDESLTLDYENGVQIEVNVLPRKNHISFDIKSVSSQEGIDAAIWGPYYTRLNKSIGEVVGIAQGEKFTVGLQSLNAKTIGGYPWKDDDFLPQMDIFSQSDVNNMTKEEGTPYTLYSVEAAKPVHNGSSLQAYVRNRDHDRIIENWGHKKYLAPAYDDGGLTGSKIALFGCPTDETLNTIGEVELAEGLPHPTIDGQWVKKSPVINSSYLIMDFDEQNIDECLKYTLMSGLNYLYHSHPFASWGHFPLIKAKFPNGLDGMKACVEKAEEAGIHIGTHTLSNFINTNDEYVTPVPDERLAKVGNSVITKEIGADDIEIEIDSPEFFNQFDNNNLRSVVIEDEIIRYGAVSESAPWKLLDCQRGAFGTSAAPHEAGETVGMLADHAYKVFLGNADLDREIAENIADFMNYTGVRMLDFDGVEGTSSTGMGKYGEALMVSQWYNHLSDDLKSHFLVGSSRTAHYLWHIYSRMNWGEPWYAGFRESQTEYRLRNQAFYKRNLMPGMLGWFRMTSSTTLEDIEWLMARSAGYDAGFAFVSDMTSIKENGNSDEIFAILNSWETARLAGVFIERQKEKMRDISTEFRLKKADDNTLELTQVYSHKFKHENKTRQPGEPLYSTFNFENAGEAQSMGVIISAKNADISNIKIEINNYKNLEFPLVLKKDQSIKITDGKTAVVYDKNWNEIRSIPLQDSETAVQKGKQTLTFDCGFTNAGDDASASVELILKGETEQIKMH